MTKSTFTDEFKQGVVQYVLDHPDESKVAIAKQFGIADSTVHKWLKDGKNNNGTIDFILEVVAIMPVMKQKKLQDKKKN